MKVVGYEEKKGEFVDERTNRTIKYDNIELHVLGSFPADRNASGQSVDKIKINRHDYDRYIAPYVIDTDDLIGKDIRLEHSLYNGKPYLIGITLI